MKTTPQELLKTVRQFFSARVTELDGLIASATDGMKAELQKLRDGFNETLAKLPPLEQVSAASEVAGSLNWLECVVERLSQTVEESMKNLTALKSNYDSKVTALHSLEGKITAGDYLTKEVSAAAVESARATARTELLPEIVATRKGALELAGLPVPDDTILALAHADYAKRLDGAKANVTALGAKGLKIGGKGEACVKQTAWLEATEFAGQMAVFDSVLGVAAPAGTEDPLLGADDPAKNAGKKTVKLGHA